MELAPMSQKLTTWTCSAEYEEVGKLYDIGPKASTYDYTLAALLARDLLSRTAGS
jgi:hypothetical protein